LLFRLYPQLEQAYELSQKLGYIYQTVKDKGVAYLKLAQWYDQVEKAGFKSFNTVSRTIQQHYQNILNFFERRSTNAAAESFNAKNLSEVYLEVSEISLSFCTDYQKSMPKNISSPEIPIDPYSSLATTILSR
jgi:hypothetical protein